MCYLERMSLALTMFFKSLVLVAWACFSEWKWPSEPELLPVEREDGSSPSPAYSPLRLPAPNPPA